jgi:hypothetical protein
MDLELWLVSGHKGKDIPNSGDQCVHVQVDVIAAGKGPFVSPVPILKSADSSYLPTASAKSLARLRVAGLEFSVPM